MKTRAECREFWVKQFQQRIDATSMAADAIRHMVVEFEPTIDIEKVCEGLRLDESYTTLHDHQIGAEILKQTDLEKQFEKFAGRGKMKELFGGEDEALSGVAAAHMADYFASVMESALRVKEYKPHLVRILASKFKNSEWWKTNEASVVKVLEKNRRRLRILKDVQES